MFDILISGGTVVDGSGASKRPADVAVAAGKVAAIGDLAHAEALEHIDATGLVVAPGFIDIHTHSDLPLLISPLAESKIRQGVTTEVIGNCGFSPAPVSDDSVGRIRQMSAFLAKGAAELDWHWRSYGDFLSRLNEQKAAVNVAPVVGHLTVRATAMGFDRRLPTVAELETMKRLVHEAMDAGAFGFSSGLIYPPSSYADTDELAEVGAVAAAHGGVYFTHIRGEGVTLLRATAEAIEIGERANLPVQIAHHKASGRPYHGRIRQAIQLSEWANERGQDVTFDVYPYTAGSTALAQIIPGWAHEGGREQLLSRLKDPRMAARIRTEIEAGPPAWAPEWDRTFVTWVSSASNKEIEGLSLVQISDRRGCDPIDAVFAVLIEEQTNASMVQVLMSEEDVQTVITHPLSMIGSDGSSLSPTGPLGEGKPHPRNYGTFPRVLQVYVREREVLSLEQAVHKMTGAPARKLGLKDRGLIREGYAADLTLFDPMTVRERGTYADPHHFAEGLPYVMVNGQIVVRRNEHTGVLAGLVLRRGD